MIVNLRIIEISVGAYYQLDFIAYGSWYWRYIGMQRKQNWNNNDFKWENELQ